MGGENSNRGERIAMGGENSNRENSLFALLQSIINQLAFYKLFNTYLKIHLKTKL